LPRRTRAVLGAQRLQRADRLGRLPLGARLQELAEQDQRDDHRRGFEIERPDAVVQRRLQQVVDAQAIAGAGAQCDQQIHVAGARAHGLPRRAVEPCAQPELHRRRQGPLDPPREHPVPAPEQRCHRRGQWQREQGGDQQVACFAAHAERPGRGLRRLPFGVTRRRTLGRIAGIGDRPDERRILHACGCGHCSALGGQVDGGVEHARHPLERPFHPSHARSARHAVDRQVDRAGPDPVAGVFDGSADGGQVEWCGALYFGHLGGEVHLRGRDAGNAGERTFHAPHA